VLIADGGTVRHLRLCVCIRSTEDFMTEQRCAGLTLLLKTRARKFGARPPIPAGAAGLV